MSQLKKQQSKSTTRFPSGNILPYTGRDCAVIVLSILPRHKSRMEPPSPRSFPDDGEMKRQHQIFDRRFCPTI